MSSVECTNTESPVCLNPTVQTPPTEGSVPQIIDKLLSMDPTICLPSDLVEIASSATRAEVPSPELAHWHHALGHVNYLAVIRFMDTHGIPVPDCDRSFARDRVRCSDCAPFKSVKQSIAKKSSSPAVTPGHTVYADQMVLPGKLGDSIRGQYTTSIIFTDTAARYSKLYPMKTSAKTAELPPFCWPPRSLAGLCRTSQVAH